VKLSTDCKGIH